jgi:hypothetical protein
MSAALPFFLLVLPLVLAAYDLGSVRQEGTSGRFPWENLTSNWLRQPKSNGCRGSGGPMTETPPAASPQTY